MGLTKPIDFEKGASKGKARKGDYRENFLDPIVQKLRRDLLVPEGYRLTSSGIARTPTWYRQMGRKWKDQILRELRRIVNRYPVIINKRRYAFKWTARDFGQANALDARTIANEFDDVRRKANEHLKIVESRLLRAEVRKTKRFDAESTKEVIDLELDFTLQDITRFFEFPADFKLEEEFFAEPKKGKSEHALTNG